MNGPLSLFFAKFIQLELRRALRDVHLRSVITLSALATLKPNIFTLRALRHTFNLAKKLHSYTKTLSAGPEPRDRLIAVIVLSSTAFLLK